MLTSALLVVVLVAAISLYRIWISTSHVKLIEKHGCESPSRRRMGDPFIGLVARLDDLKAIMKNHFLSHSATLHTQFGHTYLESTLFGQDLLKTSNQHNIQTIFSTKSQDWVVEPSRRPSLAHFLGDGILTKDGPYWTHSRSLLKPLFHKDHIFDIGMLDFLVSEMTRQIPQDGSTIDLQPLLLRLFIDVSTAFALGSSIGMLNNQIDQCCLDCQNNDNRRFWNSFKLSLERSEIQLLLGPIVGSLVRLITRHHWKIVHQFIDSRIEQISNRRTEDTGKHHSVLSSVAQRTNNGTELRNHILQTMLAAQDTSSTLVSTTLFLLARHPKLWDRVRDEVASLDSASITVNDMKKLSFLRNVIRETLRLYPIFPVLGRTASIDTVLPRGGGTDGTSSLFVAQGTDILVDFYVFNHDKNVYGNDADSFDPDRWDRIQPGPWQFLPFGGGPRTCLGQEKALAEASFVLICLAQRYYRIESRDTREFQKAPGLVGRNVNGCHIALFS